jgi:hypothetical protein
MVVDVRCFQYTARACMHTLIYAVAYGLSCFHVPACCLQAWTCEPAA